MKAKEEASTQSPADEVERVARTIQREARENGADSPVDYGDAEQLARAALSAIKGQQPTIDEVEQSWLVRQLEAWPTRIDPEKTTNIEYLMKQAAQAIRNGDEGMRLKGIIYRNCDPFDATTEDAEAIKQIADEITALDTTKGGG